jgi:hypothetical protein
MIVCRNCGAQSPDDALYCESCGLRIAPYTAEEARAYAERLQGAAAGEKTDAGGQAVPVAQRRDSQTMSVCAACLYRGSPVTRKKGSVWTEVLMWSFIIPGPFYTVWRLKSRQRVCPQCGRPGMVPVDTPVGERLLKHLTELDAAGD